MANLLSSYFNSLHQISKNVEVTGSSNEPLEMAASIDYLVNEVRAKHAAGKKIIFIGNGGSAAIASHLAVDYSKNGNIRATALNDPATLTCLSNDLGYQNVFAKQIELHGQPGDMLVAISSSGCSENILNSAAIAKDMDVEIVTLSGFDPQNKLRLLGDLNFYVPSLEYGFVEILHLSICHAVLDVAMGWKPEQRF